MALTKYATHLLAGALALASIGTVAAQSAPALIVGDGTSVPITSPTQYIAAGSTSTLRATAAGYVLCANVDIGAGVSPGMVSFAPLRDGWSLPTAGDVQTVNYNGGILYINKSTATSPLTTTLVCQLRDGEGKVATAYSAYGDRLFDDTFDLDANARQRSYLANWAPAANLGFHWSAPDWKRVPNDSCVWGINPNNSTEDSDYEDVPQIAESGLCAAATGVRTASSQNDARYGDRAPTMWANTTTSGKFVYLARIDARLGPQSADDLPNSHFVSTGELPHGSTPAASFVDVAIRDAYDSNYLAPGATYCFLNELPVDKMDGSNLRDDVCASSHAYFTGTLNAGSNDGNLYERISLTPYGQGRIQSLYVAVVRARTAGGSIASCQPAAALAVLPNPDYSAQNGGDAFTGDDVVYAFRNGDSFSWMGMGCS